jgi:hypothetical protein
VTGSLYNPNSFAASLPEDKPVVFVIGAMAAGHILQDDHPYVRTHALPSYRPPGAPDRVVHSCHGRPCAVPQVEEMVSLSDFPVSNESVCCLHAESGRATSAT